MQWTSRKDCGSCVLASLFTDAGYPDSSPSCPIFRVAEQRKNPAGERRQPRQVQLVVIEYRNESFGWTSAQVISTSIPFSVNYLSTDL